MRRVLEVNLCVANGGGDRRGEPGGTCVQDPHVPWAQFPCLITSMSEATPCKATR